MEIFPLLFFSHQTLPAQPEVDTHLLSVACWEVSGPGLAMALTLPVFTLQTLCETLHNENKELRTKLEHDLEQRNQALEKLR